MDDLDSLRRGKAGEEVGISDVELAWFRTIDLEDAEWQMPFAASRDQNFNCAPGSVGSFGIRNRASS